MNKSQKLFVVVLTALGLAVVLLQIPAVKVAQDKAYDQRAASDLQLVKTSIDSKNQVSSPSLDDLSTDAKLANSKSDYTIKSVTEESYELCATFRTDTTSGKPTDAYLGSSYVNFDLHPKGNHCFKVSLANSYYNYPMEDFDTTTCSSTGLGCSPTRTKLN